MPLPAPGLATLVAALFSLLVPLYLLAPVAFAAGDDIQIVSNEREVRFPGDVIFNLKVEGEADIVEVKLYYRVATSGTWAYAYTDFTPARQVETSFNLKVSGASYVPPGTQLEYYYAIRDAQGNALETGPENFVYIDNRLPWRTTEAGPLTIFWYEQSEERVMEVAGQVEASIGEIRDLLQLDLDRPLKGIIYNSRADAEQSLPFQSRTITEEKVFQGFAFPGKGMFVGIGLEPDLLVHESAHLLLQETTSAHGAEVPAWVDEGFASYVEPGARGYRRGFSGDTSPDLMPLRFMYAVPGRPEDIRYFYRKAESVVGYLLETRGAPRFRAFLGRLNNGRNVDQALTGVYRFDIDGLDKEWSSSVSRSAHGDSGDSNPFPFALLDTALIAILALVAVGAMVAGFVRSRLKRGREGSDESDGLTEEEWEGRP